MHHKKLGCLIIHGFGGGIHEIETLSSYLVQKGYDVACPSLKGHTGNRQDMKKATYEDWIESAEIELIKLFKKTSHVAIIGFSMGGLIAANLAHKYKIKAIVTINTPIYFWDIRRVLMNLLEDAKNKNLNNLTRYLKANNASPPAALRNFLIILRKTKPMFKEIRVPFLIIQAMDDDTVRNKSALYIYNNILCEQKEIEFFNNGGHLILLSNTKQKVIPVVENFLLRINEELL